MRNLLFRFLVICATFHAGRIFERERAWWACVMLLSAGLEEIHRMSLARKVFGVALDMAYQKGLKDANIEC